MTEIDLERGLTALRPAPTGFPIVDSFRVTDRLPGAGALRRNAAVLQEWIGMLWLAIRPVTP